MKNILCAAIALTLMAGAAVAEPIKMTTDQLDQVTAGAKKKYKIIVKNSAIATVVADDYSNAVALAVNQSNLKNVKFYIVQYQ